MESRWGRITLGISSEPFLVCNDDDRQVRQESPWNNMFPDDMICSEPGQVEVCSADGKSVQTKQNTCV